MGHEGGDVDPLPRLELEGLSARRYCPQVTVQELAAVVQALELTALALSVPERAHVHRLGTADLEQEVVLVIEVLDLSGVPTG